MSFKINNPCRQMIARSYTSAFKCKRNPAMYNNKRTDSYNFSSAYSAILGTSYSTQFMRSMETYLSSEEETNKKSPVADQTPESAMGVKGGYRSRTVMNNPYHAQKINELKVQNEQTENNEYSTENQLNDLLFEMKTRMSYMW